MSKYTTQFKYPIEMFLELKGLDATEENWPETYANAGLDDYPIFEESHREVLNTKIYRRFWFREIGFETWGHFRWKMRQRMHEIMPYYNQLYESELLEITDPLYSKDMYYDETWTRDEQINTDEQGTDDRTQRSETDTDASTESDERNVFQDTPMNTLSAGRIESLEYATNVTYDDATTSSRSHSETDSTYDQDTTLKRDETGDYDGTKATHERGYDKQQAELLLKYRETFLNIDLMILQELETLFMGLW